jgi:uncharacterized repeat protein (TIGR04138 family)
MAVHGGGWFRRPPARRRSCHGVSEHHAAVGGVPICPVVANPAQPDSLSSEAFGEGGWRSGPATAVGSSWMDCLVAPTGSGLLAMTKWGHDPAVLRIAGPVHLCYPSGHAMMHDLDFAEVVDLICKEDSRYDKKAYFFVRGGLDETVKALKKSDPDRLRQSQHISGRELLEGLRAHALDQFGPLAKTVLVSWGVARCADFGEIVFNLIEYNVFSKTENDRREDFAEVYDFEEAFVKPFQPAGGRKSGPPTEVLGSA